MTKNEVNRILAAYSIRPRRDAGQNFLVDETVAWKIVEAACIDGKPAVEIGPGLGILTDHLLDRAELVVGIELGERLCQYLADRFRDRASFILINGDFLDLEVEELADYGGKFSIVSNLPFSISKPAVSKILRMRESIDSATVTVQQEVADRITARAGTREYGVLTVMVAYWAKAEPLFSIPGDAFFPRPRVNSCTLRLEMYAEPPLAADDEETFQMVVRGAFSQRRKMLRNALAPYLGLTGDEIKAVQDVSGIDLSRRGETLSLREFVGLSDAITGCKL